MQVRIRFQPPFEVTAQCGSPYDSSGGILQDLGCDGRGQDNMRIVMRHDGVEIVGVPRSDPLPCKFGGWRLGSHAIDGTWWPAPFRVFSYGGSVFSGLANPSRTCHFRASGDVGADAATPRLVVARKAAVGLPHSKGVLLVALRGAKKLVC